MMMRDCADGEVRDLLPDYVHQTLSAELRARIDSHVASCTDCSAEVALLLQVGIAFPTPAVDVQRIVASLPAAPRRVTVRAAAGRRSWQLAAAATVVLVAGMSLALLRGTFVTAGNRQAAVPSVPSAQLPASASRESVAAGGQPGARAAGLTFDGGLSDLTDQQVQSLLGEIDALDAKPNAEPESNVGHIVPEREGEI